MEVVSCLVLVLFIRAKGSFGFASSSLKSTLALLQQLEIFLECVHQVANLSISRYHVGRGSGFFLEIHR